MVVLLFFDNADDLGIVAYGRSIPLQVRHSSVWGSNAYLHIPAIPGSFVFTMFFLPLYIVIAPRMGFSLEYRGLDPQLFTDSVFWFTIVLVPAICLCRDFVWK